MHPPDLLLHLWPFVASVAAVGLELIFDIYYVRLFVGLLHPPDLLACGLVAALPRRCLAVPRAVMRALAPRAALHGAHFAAGKAHCFECCVNEFCGVFVSLLGSAFEP